MTRGKLFIYAPLRYPVILGLGKFMGFLADLPLKIERKPNMKRPLPAGKGVDFLLLPSYHLLLSINLAARRPISTAKFVPRSQG